MAKSAMAAEPPGRGGGGTVRWELAPAQAAAGTLVWGTGGSRERRTGTGGAFMLTWARLAAGRGGDGSRSPLLPSAGPRLCPAQTSVSCARCSVALPWLGQCGDGAERAQGAETPGTRVESRAVPGVFGECFRVFLKPQNLRFHSYFPVSEGKRDPSCPLVTPAVQHRSCPAVGGERRPWGSRALPLPGCRPPRAAPRGVLCTPSPPHTAVPARGRLSPRTLHSSGGAACTGLPRCPAFLPGRCVCSRRVWQGLRPTLGHRRECPDPDLRELTAAQNEGPRGGRCGARGAGRAERGRRAGCRSQAGGRRQAGGLRAGTPPGSASTKGPVCASVASRVTSLCAVPPQAPGHARCQ